jgi:hypothetical protein
MKVIVTKRNLVSLMGSDIEVNVVYIVHNHLTECIDYNEIVLIKERNIKEGRYRRIITTQMFREWIRQNWIKIIE